MLVPFFCTGVAAILGYIWLTSYFLPKKRQKIAVQQILQHSKKNKKEYRKNVIAIINPIGGNGRAKQIFLEYESLLQHCGFHVTPFYTQYKGHGTSIAESIGSDKSNTFDLCICFGGDGLLCEVINGLRHNTNLPNNSLPLAIIPCGTSNGVATSLGLLDPLSSIKSIIESKVAPVDILNVSIGKDFQMLSVVSVEWGLVAEVDYLSETTMRWMGVFRNWLIPFAAILKNESFRGKLHLLPLKGETIQGKYCTRQDQQGTWYTIEDDFTTVLACNIPWVASDLLFAPKSMVDDGCITVVLIRRLTRLALLKAFLDAASGNHIHLPGVEMIRCSSIQFEPADGCIVVDGERIPPGTVQVTMHSHRASMYS